MLLQFSQTAPGMPWASSTPHDSAAANGDGQHYYRLGMGLNLFFSSGGGSRRLMVGSATMDWNQFVSPLHPD